MSQSVPAETFSGEISRELDPKDLATLVDVFRTLLEWERKYGSGIETERPNGSDHHQPSL